MFMLLTLLCLAASPLWIGFTNGNRCLSNPPEAIWETGGGEENVKSLTMTFDAHCLTPPGMAADFTMCTRLYNGMLPAPTLRMERGETYHVTLINNLGPEHEMNSNQAPNTIRNANSTNLHTHGLHVSGLFPGDDSIVSVAPQGGNRTYEWQIPCDHFQGIHWYHPHMHGSVALHSGGGANGVIIVDDDESDGLSQLNEFPEIILQIHHMDLPFLAALDPLDRVTRYAGSGPSSFHLINGEYRPTICIEKNKWYRIRISHSDIKANMVLDIEAPDCRIFLYAKDGLPVKNAPRKLDVNKLFFSMPSRVEIAVSCSVRGKFKLKATRHEPNHMRRHLMRHRRRRNRERMRGGMGMASDDEETNVIGYLSVRRSSNPYPPDVSSDISPTKVPSYLEDLTALTVSGPNWTTYTNNGATNCAEGQTWCIEIGMTMMGGMGSHGFTLNGVQFNGNYMETLKVGSYNQWYATNARVHPIHVHVNHLQVQEVVSYGVGETGFRPLWTQRGDWLDTQHFDGYSRLKADLYGGNLIVHCHVLQHEDLGAMTVLKMKGGCDAKCSDVSGVFLDATNTCDTARCDCEKSMD